MPNKFFTSEHHELCSLAEKRLWTARVALNDGSSRHWARQERVWPWTVGELSIRRANSRFWIKNLCCRKRASSASSHSSSCRSGCSNKTITTSTEKSRWTICRRWMMECIIVSIQSMSFVIRWSHQWLGFITYIAGSRQSLIFGFASGEISHLSFLNGVKLPLSFWRSWKATWRSRRSLYFASETSTHPQPELRGFEIHFSPPSAYSEQKHESHSWCGPNNLHIHLFTLHSSPFYLLGSGSDELLLEDSRGSRDAAGGSAGKDVPAPSAHRQDNCNHTINDPNCIWTSSLQTVFLYKVLNGH